MGFDDVPELMSVTEAAESMHVSRQRVLQMIEEGKFPRHKVGTTYVVPRSALIFKVIGGLIMANGNRNGQDSPVADLQSCEQCGIKDSQAVDTEYGLCAVCAFRQHEHDERRANFGHLTARSLGFLSDEE